MSLYRCHAGLPKGHKVSQNKHGWIDMIKDMETQDGEQYADRYLV